MDVSDFQSLLCSSAATIDVGEALSAPVDLAGTSLIGIAMPAAWTTAGISFQVSADGTTYQDLYDAGGNEISLTAVAGHYLRLDPKDWSGIRFLKVRSGASGSAVNQTGGAVVTLISRPVRA